MELLFTILLVLTSLMLIMLVLLHKGRGGGLSDMFGGGVSSSLGGSSVAEKNLDRITIGIGAIWFACIVAFNGVGEAPVFGLNVWANDDGGRWVLKPRVRYDPGLHFEHHQDVDWSLTVLFVRKELCTIQQ